MSTTIVETVVEDRLRPLQTTSIAPSTLVVDKPQPNTLYNKNLLMRTSSFDRLRQFPTYFCRQSSAEIAVWLSSSKLKLSSYLALISKQFHGVLLAVSVYSAVALLAIQLIVGLVILLSLNPPTGLIFLIGCVLIVAYLAVQILNITTCRNTCIKRQSRSRLPVYQQEHKKHL